MRMFLQKNIISSSLILMLLILALASCSREGIIGTWKEVDSGKEILKITETEFVFIQKGTSNKNNPFKMYYDVIEDTADVLIVDIKVYEDSVLLQSLLHRIEYISKNEIHIENISVPDVKGNTYKRVSSR